MNNNIRNARGANMALEEQIRDIEQKFPEMKGKLGKYCNGYDRTYWQGEVKLVQYLETNKSQMVIAHWQEFGWDDGGPRRAFAWVTLYKKDKKEPFSYVKQTHIFPRKEIVE